jgi:hypothetical protein
LSGLPEELVHDAVASMHSENRTTLIRDVIEFLLDSQYIADPMLQDRLFKAVIGTGIGLNHSGELSDWILFAIAEKHLLTTMMMQRHHIRKWWRFKDDILILSDCMEEARAFVKNFMVSAKYYKAICDRVAHASAGAIEFLDINIEQRLGRYVCFLYEKPILKGPPLCFTSMHPPSTVVPHHESL